MAPVCPRCGGAVRAPDLVSSRWRCDHDGDIDPLHLVAPVTAGSLASLSGRMTLPVWVLDPAPVGWTLGGLAYAGEERTGTRATMTAWCGPSPAGGVGDVLLVTEEPGVGLGSHYAGHRGLDAGDWVVGKPDGHVRVRGRPVPLWECGDTPEDRVALVGETDGQWLWMVCWPLLADLLLLEELHLRDARREHCVPQLGAASLRVSA